MNGVSYFQINALTRNKTSLVDGAFGDVKEMIMSTQKQPGGSQPNQIQVYLAIFILYYLL